TGHLDRIGGLVRTAPVLAVLVLLPALSLAGIPPLSGFVAQLALVEAVLDGGWRAIGGASRVGSLHALFSMVQMWADACWGEDNSATGGTRRLPAPMVGSTAVLVVLGLAVAVFAGPLYALSERTATDLLDGTTYVQAVLGR